MKPGPEMPGQRTISSGNFDSKIILTERFRLKHLKTLNASIEGQMVIFE